MKKFKTLNNFQTYKVKGGVDPISAFAIAAAFFSAAIALEDIIRSKHKSFHKRRSLDYTKDQTISCLIVS